MRPVAPRVGFPEVTLAEEQEQFYVLTAAVIPYTDGTRGILTRWRPSPEEREAIANGEDVYLTVMTADGRPQPVALCIGWPPGGSR